MREIMQQTSHRGHQDTINGGRRRPTPFLFSHRPDRGIKRLVGITLLAALIGLLVTLLFIPDALQ